ncbi:MAG: sigma 54-interacting transcriptional regulator, partial [Myxococcales bacterium]
MRKPSSPNPAVPNDLRARVHFSAETGQIWLHEHRMLLVHAEAMASLRKELIDTLGTERAKGVLLRMGYTSGKRDAELAGAASGDDAEAFMTGPRLHALEGFVRGTPIHLDLERAASRFTGEFLWENSWEGTWHKKDMGIHTEPVCWTQIGYACGYTSAFMGRRILYKEVECVGAGGKNCRIIGKPIEEWPDAAEQLRYFHPENIADELLNLQTQLAQLRSSMDERESLPEEMVGDSPAFRAAYGLLRKAASANIAVLLLGETGVGKEMFARYLHQCSPRAAQPFVAVNCAAIPPDLVESELFGVEKGAYTGASVSRPGRFERAHGGTLFLDEVGDLPLSAQAKLLRVLLEGELERLGYHKNRKVDVRLVAATNANLQALVKEGRFRSDLYYRLNAYQVFIPALRDRKDDISPLAKRFLAKYSALHEKKLLGFSDKAKRALLDYPWPGNIRELQNMIERGVILAPQGARVEIEHLFTCTEDSQAKEIGLNRNGELDVKDQASLRRLCDSVLNGTVSLDAVEAMLLEAAVDRAHGNLSSAARMLGITRPRLAYRLKRLHDGADCDGGEPTAAETPDAPAAPAPPAAKVVGTVLAGA